MKKAVLAGGSFRVHFAVVQKIKKYLTQIKKEEIYSRLVITHIEWLTGLNVTKITHV